MMQRSLRSQIRFVCTTLWISACRGKLAAKLPILALTLGILCFPPDINPQVIIPGTGSSGGGGGGPSSLPGDPVACASNKFVTDLDINGVLTCLQPASGDLSDAASLVTLTGVQRVLSKQIVPRAVLQTVTSNAITPDCDDVDLAVVPALAAGLTINAPVCDVAGNPVNGQELMFRFKDATSRTLTWNAAYTNENGLTIPTATTGDGTTYDFFKFVYNSTSTKWGLVATTLGAVSGPTTDDNVLVGNGTISQSKALPDCDDSGGNHLNYDTTTNAFTCGTSGGAGSPTFTTVKNLPITGVKLPTSNPATIDVSETNNRLLFDASTSECVVWPFVWPTDWTSGGALKVQYSMVSATTGGVSIDVSVMAVTPGDAADINTESFDTVNNCDDATVPGTVGFLDQISCTLTNKDSVAAGDYVKIKLCRAVADTADTATGDMEVVGVELSYTH